MNRCPEIFMAVLLCLWTLPISASVSVAEVAGSADDTLGLAEALEIALDQNAMVRAAAKNLESAEFSRSSARAEMYPRFSTSYSYTGLADDPYIRIAEMPPTQMAASDQFRWDFTVVQPLFTGFALSTQHEMAQLGVGISEIESEQTRLDVIKGTTSAYYGVLFTARMLGVADEAVTLLESHERDTRKYFDHGVIRLNELLRVQVALSDARQRREAAAAAGRMALSDLNRWLAFDINRETRIEDVDTVPDLHLDLEEMICIGLENRPLLRALHLSRERLRKIVVLERSEYFPEVTIVGGYERYGHDALASNNDFSNDHNAFVSVSARWTLFDSFKTRSKVARAGADVRAFEERFRSIEDGVRLEIKNAFLCLQVARMNIGTAEASLGQARENLRITRLGFHQQAATSTELLDARTDLTLAQTNYYQSLYGYLDALAALERAVGGRLNPL